MSLIEENLLTGEERVLLSLRGLYREKGYQPFRMSRFEEYDLYARNKDFLVSENVITFTDTDGRLLALKPDVTLSIVRSAPEEGIQRVHYQEKVYRVGGFSRTFQEITQTGIECIGELTERELAEVLCLAAASLGCISEHSVLHVSHMGAVARLMDQAGLTSEQRKMALEHLSHRAEHLLRAELSAASVPEGALKALCRLCRLTGGIDEVSEELRGLGCAEESEMLRRLFEYAAEHGQADRLSLDFSVVNDLGYYNGIVFHGYVDGVPVRVLSGGQYDRLLKKLGRKGRAAGFAVYVDTLETLLEGGVTPC